MGHVTGDIGHVSLQRGHVTGKGVGEVCRVEYARPVTSHHRCRSRHTTEVGDVVTVSYTHLRAHETEADL
eukprot:1332916-Rhodomonas_salina.1